MSRRRVIARGRRGVSFVRQHRTSSVIVRERRNVTRINVVRLRVGYVAGLGLDLSLKLALDISVRDVMDLKPGPNDVSRLVPGVYFVREAQAQAQAHAVRKVVIAR